MDRKEIAHQMAEILRQQNPEMCETLDELLRAGQSPQVIQRYIDRTTPKGSIIPGMVNAYLRDRDPDFAREEDAREERAAGKT